MRYEFLTDTYRTESQKVVSVWAMFDDDDLRRRLHPTDTRGRSLLEHMVHQSVSENLWFATMLEISVTDTPLPNTETRLAFMHCYVEHANRRLAALLEKDDAWWEQSVPFFEVSQFPFWGVEAPGWQGARRSIPAVFDRRVTPPDGWIGGQKCE